MARIERAQFAIQQVSKRLDGCFGQITNEIDASGWMHLRSLVTHISELTQDLSNELLNGGGPVFSLESVSGTYYLIQTFV